MVKEILEFVRSLETARLMAAIVLAAMAGAAILLAVPSLRWALVDSFWRSVAGIILFAVGWLLTYPVGHAWRSAAAQRDSKKRLSRLERLTPHECKVLAQFLVENTTTKQHGIGIGPVDALAKDGILSIIYGPIETGRPYACFRIDEKVWQHLHKNPHLVGLEPNETTLRNEFD